MISTIKLIIIAMMINFLVSGAFLLNQTNKESEVQTLLTNMQDKVNTDQSNLTTLLYQTDSSGQINWQGITKESGQSEVQFAEGKLNLGANFNFITALIGTIIPVTPISGLTDTLINEGATILGAFAFMTLLLVAGINSLLYLRIWDKLYAKQHG